MVFVQVPYDSDNTSVNILQGELKLTVVAAWELAVG